jgi:hypothetical protein
VYILGSFGKSRDELRQERGEVPPRKPPLDKGEQPLALLQHFEEYLPT